MRRSATRILSLTFVPALIALVGFAANPAQAIEPQDTPATTGRDQPHTKHGERKHATGHHKQHHKHHHDANGAAKKDAK